MSITPIRAMDFSGKAYIVMDTFNKTVLEAKNEHYVQSVASISKIMTAIVAIENGNLDDEYEIGEEVNQAWGSGVYIHIGDHINLRDLYMDYCLEVVMMRQMLLLKILVVIFLILLK